MEAYGRALKEQGPKWIWKDRKDGFKAFIKTLNPTIKVEVVEYGTLKNISVFRVEVIAGEA